MRGKWKRRLLRPVDRYIDRRISLKLTRWVEAGNMLNSKQKAALARLEQGDKDE
jgi:hypothetical protein